jgi:hypothetical protein
MLSETVRCSSISVYKCLLAVDPKNFEKLDRRSTMLMAASRNQAEDVEKNGITALEERRSFLFQKK